MGKRLTCQHCGAANEYDVPGNEVTASLRQIPCRACGHRFDYGFKPEYVTEAEPEPRKERAPNEPYDSAVEALIAKERLTRHVMQYRDYRDCDRDILLLHLFDMIDHLDHDLAAIKRTLDVLVVRSR